jgi:GntR family transcriptional regulator, transcriptional repressor for pyruvate dehydrogenase complex
MTQNIFKPQAIPPTTTRSGLPERAALQIERFISDMNLAAGDKLPGERGLGRDLNVSRTMLRDAIRILEGKGIVSVQPGRGIFIVNAGLAKTVEAVSDHLLRQDMKLGDLVEARRLLEGEIGYLAAIRRTKEDARLLERSCDQMEKYMNDSLSFMQEDLRFHALMAEAARNRLFPIWMQPTMAMMLQLSPSASLAADRLQRVLSCHRAIYVAIEARKPIAARLAVNKHIDQFVSDSKYLRANPG